jgi:hypothetical protein
MRQSLSRVAAALIMTASAIPNFSPQAAHFPGSRNRDAGQMVAYLMRSASYGFTRAVLGSKDPGSIVSCRPSLTKSILINIYACIDMICYKPILH